MRPKTQAKLGPSELAFPGRARPALVGLAVVPLAVVGLIAALIATQRLPLPLLGLLGIVVVTALPLALVALCELSGTRIHLEASGIRVERLIGSATYAWKDIEAVKVIAPTGTLGDDPLAETNRRTGLGLFIRNSPRARSNDLDADIVLCAAGIEDADRLVIVAQRITESGPKLLAPKPRSPARPRLAHQRSEFRQQRSHADG